MSENSRRPVLWFVVAMFLLAAAAIVILTGGLLTKKAAQRAQNPAMPIPPRSGAQADVNGLVTAKGKPIEATIFVVSAGPKKGPNSFNPDSYSDCGKHARADGKGHFKIKALDSALKFRLLAIAKGYQPKYADNVDPTKPKLVKITLNPINDADVTPEHSLHGRIVDSKGAPIEGAVVEMRGVQTKGGGGMWGRLDGYDHLAVSDGKGEFALTAKKPFEMMSIQVSARSYADKYFNELASGATSHDLTLTDGATLTGHVALDGKPLPGVTVGLSSVQRNMESDLGHFTIGTDADGKFTFINLPPDGEFHLYTSMESMTNYGAAPIREIRTAKDGGSNDVGELTVAPAHRLAGRVVLSDGASVPRNTRLYISRDFGWDGMNVRVDEDGSFDVSGIPSEIISLYVEIKGYHVSPRNLSLEQWNPNEIAGRVDRDISGLELLLEKGPEPEPDYNHPDPDRMQNRERTLRGAEGKADHSEDWTISGQVVDSKTREPLQHFHVTPGQSDQFDRSSWSTMRSVDASNGVYTVYISKRSGDPVIKVEAEGYMPASLPAPAGDATNVDFVMKKGSGPSGTVVSSDGLPLSGVTVALLTGEMNEAYFDSEHGLSGYGNRSGMHKTDEFGNFAFKPELGMKYLAASSSNGFGVTALDSFATNPRVVLAPLGKIKGTLTRPTGPGTNETLDVGFANADGPRINMWLQAETDKAGNFSVDRVPPGHLQISSRQYMGGRRSGGWSSEPLQEVDLQPGQTLEVKISAGERQKQDAANNYRQPEAKLVPGVEVKGVVLLPDGKPAANADVALQVQNKFLGLGKGAFTQANSGDENLRAVTGADGSFTLPMYEEAQSIIALNEQGYAQVSLTQLKASPNVTLQKWGRIEGVLRVGNNQLGTNQQVVLNASQGRWARMQARQTGKGGANAPSETLMPPYYDFNAYKTRTDNEGKFVFTFVPPGEVSIARLVARGNSSWMHSPLATVEVKPGETLVTNIGGTGRKVIGKLKMAEGDAAGFGNGMVMLQSPIAKLLRKMSELKTDEERQTFMETDEFKNATRDARNYSGDLKPDGSFSVEDVAPGKYEVTFQPRRVVAQGSTYTTFSSDTECVVPEAKESDGDSAVDLGQVVLQKISVKVPKMAGRAK